MARGDYPGVYPYDREGRTLYRALFRDSAGRQRQKRGFTSATDGRAERRACRPRSRGRRSGQRPLTVLAKPRYSRGFCGSSTRTTNPRCARAQRASMCQQPGSLKIKSP
jgi:hypothetical protein